MARGQPKIILVAFAVLLFASAALASLDSTSEILGRSHRVATTLAIAMGPLFGWVVCIKSGWFLIWSVVPATMFCVFSLRRWIRDNATAWLVVTIVAWLASGYFFAVGIWV